MIEKEIERIRKRENCQGEKEKEEGIVANLIASKTELNKRVYVQVIGLELEIREASIY